MAPDRASSSPPFAGGATASVAAVAFSTVAAIFCAAAAISLSSSARRLRLRTSELEARLEELAEEEEELRRRRSSPPASGGAADEEKSAADGDGLTGKSTRISSANGDESVATAAPAADSGDDSDSSSVLIRPIGTITSPYPQRAGCPRQGLLAPHSRSLLVLNSDVPLEVTDGLERYSHVWVVFRFHLNPTPKGRSSTRGKCGGGGNRGGGADGGSDSWSYPTKIRPPRAGGLKLGVLATRSPHRPNELGMSVGLLESIDVETYYDPSTKGRKRRRVALRLLGLDLVDGTPVLDVKPYVPWDAVTAITEERKVDRTHIVSSIDEEELGGAATDGTSGKAGAAAKVPQKLRVPPWVAADDELGRVSWTREARDGVRKAREAGELGPLYPPLEGGSKDNGDDGDDEVCRAIEEVVAQDPRSLKEGRGKGGGGGGNGGDSGNSEEEAAPYEITFCALRVSFRVTAPTTLSQGETHSKPVAVILSAVPDTGDPLANPGSYQHNLYLRREAESEERSQGRPRPRWARAIREGDDKLTALTLKGGTVWKSSISGDDG